MNYKHPKEISSSPISVLLLAALIIVIPQFGRPADRGALIMQEAFEGQPKLPRYRALVIGINSYQHWPRLKQAREDSEKLVAILSQKYGFSEITTLYDEEATLLKITGALRDLAAKSQPNDAVLIYFAGHGHYDSIFKTGYWVPVKGRETSNGQPVLTDWLDTQMVTRAANAMQAKHVLVISDSCFSGALLMRSGSVSNKTRFPGWAQKALNSPSRWCLTSGALETVPDASVFALKIRQFLEAPPKPVFSVEDLFASVRRGVETFTKSKPLGGPLQDPRGSLEGEFIFVRKDGNGYIPDHPNPRFPPSSMVREVEYVREDSKATSGPAARYEKSSNRFTRISDTEIRDQLKKCVWVIPKDRVADYGQAKDLAESYGAKLPKKEKLKSLITRERPSPGEPYIDPLFTSVLKRNKVWTGSKGFLGPAYAIDFDKARVATDSTSEYLSVILVREGL